MENQNEDRRIWDNRQLRDTNLACLERMCDKQSSKKPVNAESMSKREISKMEENKMNNTSNASNNDMIMMLMMTLPLPIKLANQVLLPTLVLLPNRARGF